MSDEVGKQLVRQLKVMNFWITLYGTLLLVTLVIILYMIYQMVVFVQETNRRIDTLKQSASDSLNMKKTACTADNAFGELLRNKTSACQ